jgi:calnexin
VIKNPKYRGLWRRHWIKNPDFVEWKSPTIPNPDYVPGVSPKNTLDPLTAIGIEWWSLHGYSGIDNLVIGRSKRALGSHYNALKLDVVDPFF